MVVAVKSNLLPCRPGMMVSNLTLSICSFTPSLAAMSRAMSGLNPIGVLLSVAMNVVGGLDRSIATEIRPLAFTASGNSFTAAGSGCTPAEMSSVCST